MTWHDMISGLLSVSSIYYQITHSIFASVLKRKFNEKFPVGLDA